MHEVFLVRWQIEYQSSSWPFFGSFKNVRDAVFDKNQSETFEVGKLKGEFLRRFSYFYLMRKNNLILVVSFSKMFKYEN